EKTAREAVFLKEEFDNVEPVPGWKLRRVTIKERVRGAGRSSLLFWLVRPPYSPFGQKIPGRKGPNPGPMSDPPPGPPGVFVQYASETSLLDQQLAGFATERDAKIAQLESETQDALVALRWRLLWIGLGTF